VMMMIMMLMLMMRRKRDMLLELCYELKAKTVKLPIFFGSEKL